MEKLFALADTFEVSVDFVQGLDPRHPGNYSRSARRIRILEGMSSVKTLCTLAHEIGHVVNDDEATIFERYSDRQERLADEWAAHFLIQSDAYRCAEERFGTRTDWIAQEIGVLERLVIAYERTLHRIGDTIYVNPKMGAGQWSHRIPA